MEHKNKKEDSLTLKDLMERAGLTEPVLSQKIGVGIKSISSWRAKKQIPRLDNALALAKELNVSLKTVARSMGMDVSGLPDDCSDKV